MRAGNCRQVINNSLTGPGRGDLIGVVNRPDGSSWGWKDLNLRPPMYQIGTLPGLSYIPWVSGLSAYPYRTGGTTGDCLSQAEVLGFEPRDLFRGHSLSRTAR